MNRILVPSDGESGLSLHAVHFAIEFAKRTGARVLFLAVDRDPTAAPDPRRDPTAGAHVAGQVERAVGRARMRGLEVESHTTTGEFVGQVAAFARDHHVSRIVVALPEPGSEDSARIEEQVNALREQLGCVLVTVRPRREHIGRVRGHEADATTPPPRHEER